MTICSVAMIELAVLRQWQVYLVAHGSIPSGMDAGAPILGTVDGSDRSL
jgi:hypothetical protein